MIASEDDLEGSARMGSVEACLGLKPNVSLAYSGHQSRLDAKVPLEKDLYQFNVSQNRQAVRAGFVSGDLSAQGTFDGQYFEPELGLATSVGKWRFFHVANPYDYQLQARLGEDKLSFGSKVEHQKVGLHWQGRGYGWQFSRNEGGNVEGYQWVFSLAPQKHGLKVEVGFGEDRFHSEDVVFYNEADQGLATNRLDQGYLNLTIGWLKSHSANALKLGYRTLSLEHFGALDLTDMDNLGGPAGLFWISQLQAEAELYHLVHRYERNLTKWQFQLESGLYYSEFDAQAALRKRLPLVVFPIKVDESNVDNGKIVLGRLGLELGYRWSESLDIQASLKQWVPIYASIEPEDSGSTQSTGSDGYSGASIFSEFKRPPGSQISVGFGYYW